MPEPISILIITGYLVKNAPSWLDSIRNAFFDRAKTLAAEKIAGYLDEKRQQRHMELVLKNAVERGIANFHTPRERDCYRDIIVVLSQNDTSQLTLHNEALQLFTLSDSPDYGVLSEKYNYPQRLSALAQKRIYEDIDVTPYLNSFFDGLIAELYNNSFFRSQMSDVIRVRAHASMQRSLKEILTTLQQINAFLVDNYSVEQFENDIKVYTAYMYNTLHYLKLIGIPQRDRDARNPDPEIQRIVVPIHWQVRERILLTRKLSDPVEYLVEDKPKRDPLIEMLEQFPYVVLLGGPGTGKSTAMKHLAWSHAASYQTPGSVPPTAIIAGTPLPLLIELRRLSEDRRNHPEYSFLKYVTKVQLERDNITINQGMFQELLERKTMLILFDGLDEVSSLRERSDLIKEIEQFAQTYPGNRILVTSRPIGYELARFSNDQFKHADVRPFDHDQMQQFLEGWYKFVLRLNPLPNKDKLEIESLLSDLSNNARLKALAENPLLLTVITALHHNERLPDIRVQIYDKCADLLLDTWSKLKGTHERWRDMKMSRDDQSDCVAHLGFTLHKSLPEVSKQATASIQSGASDVSAHTLLREIENFLKPLISEGAERRLEAERFLNLIQVEAGLIVERGKNEDGDGLFGFVHRTFQEYFAAIYVYERFLQEVSTEVISDFLKQNLHDPHWGEVTLLLLSKLKSKPVTALMRGILDGQIQSVRSRYTDVLQQDFFFVNSCLAEGISVDMTLADYVISHLCKLVQHSPFSSQQNEALDAFTALMRTRQYADLVREKLRSLLDTDHSIDPFTKMQLVRFFYLANSGTASTLNSERIWASELLLHLARNADIRTEQVNQIARSLRYFKLGETEEKTLAIQLLLTFSQREDITVEEVLQSVEAIYNISLDNSQERYAAAQVLVKLLQKTNTTVEQFVAVAKTLYRIHSANSGGRKYAIRSLLQLIEHPGLSFQETMQVAKVPFWADFEVSEGRGKVTPKLLRLANQRNLTFEERFQVVKELLRINAKDPEGKKRVVQWLQELVSRTNLTPFEVIKLTGTLLEAGLSNKEEKDRAIQSLLAIAMRRDIPIEVRMLALEILIKESPTDSSENNQARQQLLWLANSLEQDQALPAIQILIKLSGAASEEKTIMIEKLMTLAELSDAKIERFIKAMWEILISGTPKSDKLQELAVLSALLRRADLQPVHLLQMAGLLYEYSQPESTQEHQAFEILLQIVGERVYPDQLRLQAALIPFKVDRANYKDRAQMFSIAHFLFQEKAGRQSFQKHWRIPTQKVVIASETTFINRLVREQLVPISAREAMYQILRDMVGLPSSATRRLILE